MSYCKNCKVEIGDQTSVCPLCQNVMEEGPKVENMYPDIRQLEKKVALASRIYIFLAILTEAILVHINATLTPQIWWSAIVGGAFLLIYIGLKLLIEYEYTYRSRIFLLTIAGTAYLVLIDYVVGFYGWSLEFCLPSFILAIDVVIAFLMIFNRRNWQSYMTWQLVMLGWSFLNMLLIYIVHGHIYFMVYIAGAITFFFFLGTFIIGGKRSAAEMKRRFHID